jgi:hypothetical protein
MFSHTKAWEERNGELSHQTTHVHSFSTPSHLFSIRGAHFPICEGERFSVIAVGLSAVGAGIEVRWIIHVGIDE